MHQYNSMHTDQSHYGGIGNCKGKILDQWAAELNSSAKKKKRKAGNLASHQWIYMHRGIYIFDCFIHLHQHKPAARLTEWKIC